MTPERLAEIRARADAATPGEWKVGESHPFGGNTPVVVPDNVDSDRWIIDALEHADAEFIARARDDIDALLADNARLQNLVAGLLEEGAARDPVVEAAQAWRIAHDDYHQGVPSDSTEELQEACMDTHAALMAALDAEDES